MKRVMFCASLVMLMQVKALAEKSEVFPFPDITVGMSSKELLEKYPTKEFLVQKKNSDQILEEGVVMYTSFTNKFWDTLGVAVENEKVKTVTYCRINREVLLSKELDAVDFSNVIENVRPLFRRLKQELGSAFEKKVVLTPSRNTKNRSAMYVWKREKDVVAFVHCPVAKYKKGELFHCQVVIAPTLDFLLECYGVLDSTPEDAKLWADAMEE